MTHTFQEKVQSYDFNEPDWVWRDGRLWSLRYDDGFTQKEDPLAESQHVFIEGNQLLQRWQNRDTFCIAELGFGTGRNFLNCCQQFTGPKLIYWATELHPLPANILLQVHARSPLQYLSNQLAAIWTTLRPHGLQIIKFTPSVELHLWLGSSLSGLEQTEMQFDAWFLDGFSPKRNPDMWSPSIITQLARLSQPGTTLATYSVASSLQRDLRQAGFDLKLRQGSGGKRQVLAAVFKKQA